MGMKPILSLAMAPPSSRTEPSTLLTDGPSPINLRAPTGRRPSDAEHEGLSRAEKLARRESHGHDHATDPRRRQRDDRVVVDEGWRSRRRPSAPTRAGLLGGHGEDGV